MRLMQALRAQSQDVKSGFEKSKLFEHHVDRGTFREAVIQDFLRPFLPERYGLISGEVFDAYGDVSGQMDIVIHDASFSPVLFKNKGNALLPAEGVFGVIEVKTNLDSQKLEQGLNTCASLKRLRREPSTSLDLLPGVSLELGPGLGQSGEARAKNPFIGAIFAYRGIAPETIGAALNARLKSSLVDKRLLPDLVVLAEPGVLFLRACNRDGTARVCEPSVEQTHWIRMDLGEDALSMFFVALNLFLSRIRLRQMDLMDLWGRLTTEMMDKMEVVA